MRDESKQLRGFAVMDSEKQREIARRGGKAAHAKGGAHEFTSEEARIAGQKGGQSVSKDRVRMAELGRRGGLARGVNFRLNNPKSTKPKSL